MLSLSHAELYSSDGIMRFIDLCYQMDFSQAIDFLSENPPASFGLTFSLTISHYSQFLPVSLTVSCAICYRKENKQEKSLRTFY